MPGEKMKIVVASANPVKVQAALNGYLRLFPGAEPTVATVSVPSGVSHQPSTNAETLQGALNRARNARQAAPEGELWFGIEGGIEDDARGMAAFAWIAAISADRQGLGRTGAFYLPPAVAALVRQGKELGDADDIVFGMQNSKQQNGAVGILSGNVIDRAALYEQAVILALLPFKNPHLY